MIESPVFWLLLLTTPLAYWSLPSRWRIGFLGAASLGYVAWLSPVNAAVIFGWSLAFYFLAPLARRPARVLRQAGAAAARVVARGAVATTAAGATTSTATLAPPAAPPATAPAPTGPQPADHKERRWVLWALVLGMVGYLACFKYLLPALAPWLPAWMVPGPVPRGGAASVLIPLGISYFTFKFIHYAVEVARGNITDRSFSQFLCYVFLFPTFSAGPIERYDHFLAHIDSQCRTELFEHGLTRIAHGLIKKFVLAEMLLGPTFQYALTGDLARELGHVSTLRVWWIAVLSYVYLYLDFSSYSDIAIGASRLFGLRIMENFDFPLLAPNLGVFWKRWHMTLTGWCQSYIFMPVLGKTRNPTLANYATFMAMGLWHAAAWPWILWGLYHATGLYFYQRWAKLKRQRKWKWTETRWWYVCGVGLTIIFVSADGLIAFGGLTGGYSVLRMYAKLLFINLP